MPQQGEEALRLREEALADYAAALLARATAAETRCRMLEAELAAVSSREKALRREISEAATSHEMERGQFAELSAALAAERQEADVAAKAAVEARAGAEATLIELRRERERVARVEAELAETKECLGRATELLLRSPSVSVAEARAPVPDWHEFAAPAPVGSEQPRRRSGAGKKTPRWILLVSALVGGTLAAVWNSCVRYSGENQQHFSTRSRGPAPATAPSPAVADPFSFKTTPASQEGGR